MLGEAKVITYQGKRLRPVFDAKVPIKALLFPGTSKCHIEYSMSIKNGSDYPWLLKHPDASEL